MSRPQTSARISFFSLVVIQIKEELEVIAANFYMQSDIIIDLSFG